jgi:hypothetical protein
MNIDKYIAHKLLQNLDTMNDNQLYFFTRFASVSDLIYACNNGYQIPISLLIRNENITESFIKDYILKNLKNLNDFRDDIYYLSSSNKLSINFIIENLNHDYINWYSLTVKTELDFIIKHKTYNWHLIELYIRYKNIPLDFIEYKTKENTFDSNFYKENYFKSLSYQTTLTEEFILRYINYPWIWYCLNNIINFSLEFIMNHIDKIEFNTLYRNPNITLDFIKQNINKISDLTPWISHKCITREFLLECVSKNLIELYDILQVYPNFCDEYITKDFYLPQKYYIQYINPIWTKEYHPYYHDTFKKQVKILLLLQKFRKPFNQLPKDVLYIIIQLLAHQNFV